MSIESTLNDLIQLPRNFSVCRDASIHSLLQESGYFAVHKAVTEDAIHDALREHPELVSDWIDFSDSKRASSGWFLRRGATGYQVGHYSDHEPVEYLDELTACAAFIKREIEDIRTDGHRP